MIVTHDQAVACEVRRAVAIRDGRTSTEVLRRTEVDAEGQEFLVAREFATLDRAGRLQLPAEYTAALGMEDRVMLELEQDHIGLGRTTPGTRPHETGHHDTPPPTRPVDGASPRPPPSNPLTTHHGAHHRPVGDKAGAAFSSVRRCTERRGGASDHQ